MESKGAALEMILLAMIRMPPCECVCVCAPQVSYDHAEFLEQLAPSKVDAILEVNMRAMVMLSQLVLPGMLSAKRGAIINIGSAAGRYGTNRPGSPSQHKIPARIVCT